MSVESIEAVIKLWETNQITVEQTIGKILLWLREHQTRLSKLETMQRRPNDTSQQQKDK
jgi:hypothetical protein